MQPEAPQERGRLVSFRTWVEGEVNFLINREKKKYQQRKWGSSGHLPGSRLAVLTGEV